METKIRTFEETLCLVKKMAKKTESKEVVIEINVIIPENLFWVFIKKRGQVPYFALAFSFSSYSKEKGVLIRFYQMYESKMEKDFLNKKIFKNFSTLKEDKNNPYKNEWVIICNDNDVYENGLKAISYLLRPRVLLKMRKIYELPKKIIPGKNRHRIEIFTCPNCMGRCSSDTNIHQSMLKCENCGYLKYNPNYEPFLGCH